MGENFAPGTCMLMCPIEELSLREREGLLHRLEVRDATKKSRLREADPNRTVKCFSRSAAGFETQPAHLLRPGPVLFKTVKYLMQEIAPLQERQLDVYEFITDRLRAVRQDMTIQRLQAKECISLLEPMIRFHVIYEYLLSNDMRFDNHLNRVHLQECFGKLMTCYKSEPDFIDPKILMIFMCCNTSHPELTVKLLSDVNESTNFDVLVATTTKNFIRLTKLAKNLDVIARAALSFSIPKLRENALKNLCHAMSSPKSSFELERLAKNLSYNDKNDVINDCKRLGIRYNETHCFFNKKDLVSSPTAAYSQKWWIVEEDIQGAEISKLILN